MDAEDEFDDTEQWTAVLQNITCADSADSHHEEEFILGANPTIRVKFPYKAYLSQEMLMQNIIEGVQKSENCLLESPTGTGKTAAILCALLAWQRSCKQKSDYCLNIDTLTVNTGCTCGLMKGEPNEYKILQKSLQDGKVVLQRYTYEYVVKEVPIEDSSVDPVTSTISSPKKKKVEVRELKSDPDEVKTLHTLCRFCIRTNYTSSRVPTIFYATRTLSQVKQVVNQLKGTVYSGAKMTILASRKHTCIYTEVQTSESVDDECQKLRQNYTKSQKMIQNAEQSGSDRKPLPVCPYYCGGQLGSHNVSVYNHFKNTQEQAWDIEDLNKYSKKSHGCSFYGTKILLEDAEIVFCTYNYLLHPGIRSKTKLNLINSVIVFDEAHNIEDLCRDLASIEVKESYLSTAVIPSFEEAFKKPEAIPKGISPVLSSLLNFCQELVTWMNLNCGTITFNLKCQTEGYKEISNEKIVSLLDEVGINEDTISKYDVEIRLLEESVSGSRKEESEETLSSDSSFEEAKGSNQKQEPFKFSISVIRFMKNLMAKFNFVLGNEKNRLQYYTAVFVKRVKQGTREIKFNNEFLFICLNPALTFEPLQKYAHSIIVASGTLSPLTSFESELNTPFNIKLSAPHVIQPNQVWAGVATVGPKNIHLSYNKYGQNLPEGQEELGRSIVEICKIVPHGVLVFLPSYTWMDKLKTCWTRFPENNTIMQQLDMVKNVYFEERVDKNKFEKDIENFRKQIVESSKGCVLFAIFRGKVSEGVDFKDNQARAVVTVGIPFSSPQDPKIKHKMNYNNSLVKKGVKEVLSGDQWYTAQAFRAMNQAFGRCVRHEKDWGSLIFLEERMTNRNKLSDISTWVRENIKLYRNDFDEVLKELQNFIQERSNSNQILSPTLENNELADTIIISQSDVPTQIVELNDAQPTVQLGAQMVTSNTTTTRTNESEIMNESSEMSMFSNEDNEVYGPTSEESGNESLYSPISVSQSNRLTDQLCGSVHMLSP